MDQRSGARDRAEHQEPEEPAVKQLIALASEPRKHHRAGIDDRQRGEEASFVPMRLFLAALLALLAPLSSGCGVSDAPARDDASARDASAQGDRLSEIKDEMDDIDRRFQAIGTPRPQTLEALEPVVDEWRPFPDKYDALLRRAEPLRDEVRGLPEDKLGVGELADTLVEMLERRRDGTVEIIGLFDQWLTEGTPPAGSAGRLEELKREQDALNQRFFELANAYNEKVGG